MNELTTNTITDAVEEYMALAMDFNSMHRSTFLTRGKWVWKHIRNNILKSVSHKWVTVDKTKSTYRAYLPKCASMFLSVSIKTPDGCIDLTPNPEMCIVDYITVDKYDCGCPKGVKECITTNETITETITIEGVSYTKTVITTVMSNGNVFKEITEPISQLDAEGNFIKVNMVDSNELICKLSVKDCGCVEVSQSNLEVLKTCCSSVTINGFSLFCNAPVEKYNPFSIENEYGHFKYDDNNTVYLEGKNFPDQVLINYTSNGDGEEDEVIPDYAMKCFFDGMHEMNSRFSSGIDRFEKRSRVEAYKISQDELEMSLPRNKINIVDWLNATNKITKW